MSWQQLYRYSEVCEQKCIPEQDQNIYSHEDTTQIDHKYMRQKHFTDHFKKYQALLHKNLLKLEQYSQSVLTKLNAIKESIELYQRDFQASIKRQMEKCELALFDEKERKIFQSYKKNDLKALTCCEMNKLINFTDVKLLGAKGIDLKAIIDKKIEQLQAQFQEFIRQSLKSNKIEIISAAQKNLLNMIKLNQSSISKLSNSNITEEIAIEQFFSPQEKTPAIVNMAKKPGFEVVQAQLQQKIQIVQDEDESYYSQMSKQASELINTNLTSKNNSKNQSTDKINKDDLIDKMKVQTFLQFDSDKQENEEEICKQVKQFEESISKSEELGQEIIQEQWHSIQQLDKILDTTDFEEFEFNIRVKVVKVLYFSVIYTKILKVKFIAGDETGLSVFFTNYCSKIKAGTQLELNKCHFALFKQSEEIINDKNYRIINEGKEKIKVNLEGVFLSQYIQPNLQYHIPDKKCTLIREVADKLASKPTFNVARMVVKVMFIMNEWSNRVFCQVGDSSGRILAYIKKDSVKTIVEGDVLKLLKVSCKKGKQPNKLINEEILYLDSENENCKVLPFKHQFLEVSENIFGVI